MELQKLTDSEDELEESSTASANLSLTKELNNTRKY